MGILRAVGNYASGMVISIATIPITNMLGGTQVALSLIHIFFDLLLDFQQGGIQRSCLGSDFWEVGKMSGAAIRGYGAEYRVRETQNQNDADDANDAESGIWYRDCLLYTSRCV